MSVLEFDGIEKRFGERKILTSIYMQCQTGRMVGLLGRNGSGKSTLMKIVFGAMQGESQSIRLNKCPILTQQKRLKFIGYLPQTHLLPKRLRVAAALRDFGLTPDALIAWAPEFEPWLSFSTEALSGGWQRMLETFLLVKSPKQFIFLDEPFSGVMPLHIERIIALINSERANKGFVLSDHLYHHIIKVVDDLYLLKDGKTYLINNPQELGDRGYVGNTYFLSILGGA